MVGRFLDRWGGGGRWLPYSNLTVTVRNHNRSTVWNGQYKNTGGLNRFYGYPISPSASIMAQNIQLFGPREGFLTHQWIIT